MSTDMYPAEPGFTTQMPAQQDPLRLVRISANLLPDEITDGRRTRRTRTAVVGGLGAVVLLLAGWYGSTFVSAGSAEDELLASEQAVSAAQSQQGKYRDLTETKTNLNAAKTQLGTLMASDTQWQKLISDIRGAAPAGTKIGTFSASVSGDSAAQGGLPSQTQDKLVGTLSISGTADTKDQIAAFVDNLRRVNGLANPLPTSVTATAGEEGFSMQVDITQAALGGRFTPDPAATPTPESSTGGN